MDYGLALIPPPVDIWVSEGMTRTLLFDLFRDHQQKVFSILGMCSGYETELRIYNVGPGVVLLRHK